jgi:enoyl-CoA hydratase/carnithine racemase
MNEDAPPSVLAKRHKAMMSIVLNRPQALNSLNLEMVRLMRAYLEDALAYDDCHFILIYGKGEKAFCAGGDIKALAKAIKEKNFQVVDQFFSEEYALDLLIHTYPKPMVLIANGVTMGGGLGLSAGADLVVATETTRMAMPETRIGFFPDVGATGWLFQKCPRGYPEFLGLTGYEMLGMECVRLGLASMMASNNRISKLITRLEDLRLPPGLKKPDISKRLHSILMEFCLQDIPSEPEMDRWVDAYFSNTNSLPRLLDNLRQCSIEHSLCEGVFTRLSERSPSAVALTLRLLRLNEGRPLRQVFETDIRAAKYLTRHHDYIEGVRARLIDKDDHPRWHPAHFEDVALDGFEMGEDTQKQ